MLTRGLSSVQISVLTRFSQGRVLECNKFLFFKNQQICRFASATEIQSNLNSSETEIIKAHAKDPPKYVLTTIRNFPSLKPQRFQPIPTSLLQARLRRDILWSAVIYDADRARVGSSNPPGRSQKGYSRKKLLKQKGTGKARVGDRGSPTRHDGGRALARNAPNDFSTELPFKVYAQAMRIALSDKYEQGKLFIIDEPLELPTKDYLATKLFLEHTDLVKENILFITNEFRENLMESTKKYSKNIDIAEIEGVKVKDVLKAKTLFIELEALKRYSAIYDIK